jgi:hypothetical protein
MAMTSAQAYVGVKCVMFQFSLASSPGTNSTSTSTSTGASIRTTPSNGALSTTAADGSAAGYQFGYLGWGELSGSTAANNRSDSGGWGSGQWGADEDFTLNRDGVVSALLMCLTAVWINLELYLAKYLVDLLTQEDGEMVSLFSCLAFLSDTLNADTLGCPRLGMLTRWNVDTLEWAISLIC